MYIPGCERKCLRSNDLATLVVYGMRFATLFGPGPADRTEMLYPCWIWPRPRCATDLEGFTMSATLTAVPESVSRVPGTDLPVESNGHSVPVESANGHSSLENGKPKPERLYTRKNSAVSAFGTNTDNAIAGINKYASKATEVNAILDRLEAQV